MNRGMLNSLLYDEIYSKSAKEWGVETISSHIYWYDPIRNNHPIVKTRKLIRGQLDLLKESVKSSTDKKFIYFICSRKKVRFCDESTPIVSSNGLMSLRVNVGKNVNSKDIVMKAIRNYNSDFIIPEIEKGGKYIRFYDEAVNELKITSVHDFLKDYEVNIGIDTEVHYVGYTKNPNDRPFNGSHTGLSDVFYDVSNEDNDFFICYNLFKVLCSAKNEKYNFNYTVANSISDEIKIDLEGEILEKCFLLYFDSKVQNRNKEKERSKMKNDMFKILKENDIKKIHVYSEIEEESEYYKFFSSSVESKKAHVFTALIERDDLNILAGSSLLDELI